MAKMGDRYPDNKAIKLFEAILNLRDKNEAARFFRDLLTLSEIREFANRFQAAKLLFQGMPYAEVADKLKMSTTTVTRVAHWLHHGMDGYKKILSRLSSKTR